MYIFKWKCYRFFTSNIPSSEYAPVLLIDSFLHFKQCYLVHTVICFYTRELGMANDFCNERNINVLSRLIRFALPFHSLLHDTRASISLHFATWIEFTTSMHFKTVAASTVCRGVCTLRHLQFLCRCTSDFSWLCVWVSMHSVHFCAFVYLPSNRQRYVEFHCRAKKMVSIKIYAFLMWNYFLIAQMHTLKVTKSTFSYKL